MNALTLAKIEHQWRGALQKVLPAAWYCGGFSRFRNRYLEGLARVKVGPVAATTAPVERWGLRFRNDLGNAAGLDKDGKLLDFQYDLGAGFAVVGTVLHRPHTGNLGRFLGGKANPWTPLPASAAAINSLGLPSKGAAAAVAAITDFRARRQPRDFPIGVSVMGHPEESGETKLAGVLSCLKEVLPVADFVEINESCPNVGGVSSDGLRERLGAMAAVRDEVAPGTPLLVKLAKIGDAATTLGILAETGMQGAVAVNTQKNYDELRLRLASADRELFDWYVKRYGGGVSGRPIAEFALAEVRAAHEVIEAQGLPLELVHVGGIATPADVAASRPYAVLREWYTGFMEALATEAPETLYPEMTRLDREDD